MNLPAHKAQLTLTHNEHRNDYVTIEQYEARHPLLAEEPHDSLWVSPQERLLAIETDSLWELRWYPKTPIGFLIGWAHELDALLEWAATQT